MSTIDLVEKWETAFESELSRTKKYSDVPVEEWKVSGRASKLKPNKEDLAWWKSNGLQHVQDYVHWFQSTGWGIALMPDGKPGIEWEAVVTIAGKEIKLIVDAIYIRPDGELVICDYKTGAHDPKGVMQLGLYATAIELVTGIRPRYGAYLMTRKTVLTDLVDLGQWDKSFFEYQIEALKAYQQVGIWPASVGNECGICSFTEYCQAFGGTKYKEVPLMQITNRKETT